MERDWKSEFGQIAERIADARSRILSLLVELNSNGAASSAVLERFAQASKEWESLLEESRSLLDEYRRSLER